MTQTQPSAAAAANLNAAVAGQGRRALDEIFRHPLSHNLAWREVVALFASIGSVEEKQNGEFLFRAGVGRLSMKQPHHKDLTGPDVMDLRHFLTRAGWAPDAAKSSPIESASPAVRLIVVIDHAGARIYQLDEGVDDGDGIAPRETHHLPHQLTRTARGENRDEIDPEDVRFFEAVAAALSPRGEIVVIGHGKGQSNEADHLSAYLQAHHKETFGRIVREIVADLPHLTTLELLDLGRHALG